MNQPASSTGRNLLLAAGGLLLFSGMMRLAILALAHRGELESPIVSLVLGCIAMAVAIFAPRKPKTDA